MTNGCKLSTRPGNAGPAVRGKVMGSSGGRRCSRINQRSLCVETRLASRAHVTRVLFGAAPVCSPSEGRLRPHIDLKHHRQREEGEGTFVIDLIVKEVGESKAGGQGNGTELP